MEQFNVELDDETATWLEFIADTRKKTIAEVIEEVIEEARASPGETEHKSG